MGFLIFNFWTIPTIFKFPKGFCFGFQGEETFRDSASDSASIHCIVNIEQFAEPQDLLVKTMVFCNFPSNDLLHLRSLRVASGQSDFQKAWNYLLSRPRWVWLNIFFFCCHYIISIWYCKILWDVMKVPGSRQSFPEVLWCGDTHQWCQYIYIYCVYIYIHKYIHMYIYIFTIYHWKWRRWHCWLCQALTNLRSRGWGALKKREAPHSGIFCLSHVAFGSWPVPYVSM